MVNGINFFFCIIGIFFIFFMKLNCFFYLEVIFLGFINVCLKILNVIMILDEVDIDVIIKCLE